MKRILCMILVAFTAATFTVAESGCTTAPSSRAAQVQTLKAVGLTADTAMRTAAQLLRDGHISRAQWDKLAVLHDAKFQPAFNTAVTAVRSDLSTVASPDLIALAAQLAALVASYETSK